MGAQRRWCELCWFVGGGRDDQGRLLELEDMTWLLKAKKEFTMQRRKKVCQEEGTALSRGMEARIT